MSIKRNKCKYCDYCKSAYMMFGFRYLRSKVYFCELHNTPINGDYGCKNRKARKTEYDLSLQRIDSVIDDIEFIFNS